MKMPLTLLRDRSNLQLAGASTVLGIAWLASLVVAGNPPLPVEVVRVVLGAVLAPLLAIVVGLRLIAAPLALTARQRHLLQASATVGVVALALTANSFAVGFDDADAGRPTQLFVSLAIVYVVASLVGFAVATATVFFVLIRRRLTAIQSIAIAAPLGAMAAPLAAGILLVPGSVIALSLVVLAYSLLPALSRTFTLPRVDRPLVDVGPVRDRVILLAAVSLTITLVVWTSGFATSIANSGTDAATGSLGVASAAGQLAVIPLLWAVAMVLGARVPATASTSRLGLAVASATVVGAVLAMIIGYSPEGDGYLTLVGVLSLGIGFWAGTVVWALYPAFSRPARIATAVVVAMAAALVYAGFAAMTGGIVLALASGFLAFGGARVLLRRRESAGSPDRVG